MRMQQMQEKQKYQAMLMQKYVGGEVPEGGPLLKNDKILDKFKL